jgi:hypothetical protein
MNHQISNLYGSSILSFASAVQQGDPLDPLLFCLVVCDLTKALKSRLNVWHLDDANLSGSTAELAADLLTIEVEAAKLGLEIRRDKSELITLNGNTSLLKVILPPQPGSSLFWYDARESFLFDKMRKLSVSVSGSNVCYVTLAALLCHS